MTVNIYQIETINYLWPVRQDFVTTVTNWHSFDAWGNRRDPLTWQSATGTLPDLFCDRGFTGHEHLAEFGLINMNGRVYDPFLCRMLSPDNYVQAPDFTQNLNRYSYCVNNPLKYNDPSGHIIGFISGFIINGFLGGITNGIFTGIDEQKRGNDFSYGFLKGFGTGFLSAGITGGLKSGMEAYLNGADFWTGNITEKYILSTEEVQSLEPTSIQNSTNYNKSISATNNDKILQARYSSVYKTKIGDNGITDITTKVNKEFILLQKQDGTYTVYYDPITKDYIGGYCRHQLGATNSSIHISPYYALNKDINVFKSIAGHEYIHALHVNMFGANFISNASERVAYQYSRNILNTGGNSWQGMKTQLLMNAKGYSGIYPSQYSIPSDIWYFHF